MRALTYAMAAIACMTMPSVGGDVVVLSNHHTRGQPTLPDVGLGNSNMHPAELHKFAAKRRRAAQGKPGKRGKR